MDNKVRAFIEEKSKDIKAKEQREKNMLLLALGLYNKVYSADDKWSKEYSLSEWNEEEQKTKYYKNEICSVTDEEYEEIKKLSYTEHNKDKSDVVVNNIDDSVFGKNSVATALSVIACIIFIGGFIAGIVLGLVGANYSSGFAFGTAIIYWCVSLVSGIMMLGFAEIIKLLNDLNNKN